MNIHDVDEKILRCKECDSYNLELKTVINISHKNDTMNVIGKKQVLACAECGKIMDLDLKDINYIDRLRE